MNGILNCNSAAMMMMMMTKGCGGGGDNDDDDNDDDDNGDDDDSDGMHMLSVNLISSFLHKINGFSKIKTIKINVISNLLK